MPSFSIITNDMNSKHLPVMTILLLGTLSNSCTQQPQHNTDTVSSAPGLLSATNKSAKTDLPAEVVLSKYEGDDAFSHSNRTGTTYKHQHYILSYSEEDEQSEWVGYELTSAECRGKLSRDGFLFEEDYAIKTGSASHYEYRNSGYDKGHLAPAGDMRFDEDALQESFLMSNISPQRNEFNAGIWNKLERQIRQWARRFGRIYVVTGPVLKQEGPKTKLRHTSKYKKRETTKITIPKAFYKVVFDFSKPGREKMIAFCIPSDTPEEADIYDYVVSVDSLEKITGLDFFNNLPTKIQSKYECRSDVALWKSDR